MSGDSGFAPEHPVARIRAKLEERRILEARFLLRQFGDAIEAGERQALAGEVSRLLAEAERLRYLARTAVAAGRHEEAAGLYRDIERIAADLPGLAEEQAALAGAFAILSRPAPPEVDPYPPAPAGEPVSADGPEATQRGPLAGPATDVEKGEATARPHTTDPVGQNTTTPPLERRRSLSLRLAVGACAVLAVLLFLIWLAVQLFRAWPERTKASPAVSSTPAPPSLRPIEVGPPALGSPAAAKPRPLGSPAATNAEGSQPQLQASAEPSPEPSPEPEPLPEPAPVSPPAPQTGSTDQALAPPPALQLGTLQVEASNRQLTPKPNRKPHPKPHQKSKPKPEEEPAD